MAWHRHDIHQARVRAARGHIDLPLLFGEPPEGARREPRATGGGLLAGLPDRHLQERAEEQVDAAERLGSTSTS